jgi:hypothetical protein
VHGQTSNTGQAGPIQLNVGDIGGESIAASRNLAWEAEEKDADIGEWEMIAACHRMDGIVSGGQDSVVNWPGCIPFFDQLLKGIEERSRTRFW